MTNNSRTLIDKEFKYLTNEVLVKSLHEAYDIGAWDLYDRIFGVLREREYFMSDNLEFT